MHGLYLHRCLVLGGNPGFNLLDMWITQSHGACSGCSLDRRMSGQMFGKRIKGRGRRRITEGKGSSSLLVFG